MKIRTGFVSNSSSSSFVIFANELNFDEIKKEDSVHVLGTCICEGCDYFELTREMYLYLKKNSDLLPQFKFYKVYKEFNESNEDASMDDLESILPLKFKVLSIEVDQHSSQSVTDLEKRYP